MKNFSIKIMLPNTNLQLHKPVLIKEVLNSFNIKGDKIVFDGTLGTGGHAESILKELSIKSIYISTDLDSKAIEISKERLKQYKAKKIFFENNFKDVKDIFEDLNLKYADYFLLDLGWGSHQISSDRGFTFSEDNYLNMNYSDNAESTIFDAYSIINNSTQKVIEDIIFGYGEERWAKKIAENIVNQRKIKPIETTFQLAQLVSKTIPRKFQSRSIHPATKTFQALRISVNDEIGSLEKFLEEVINFIKNGSVLSIITFHSIEDRVVKHAFARWNQEGLGAQITKKPISPSAEEIKENPRARSAKLRSFLFN